MFGSTMKDMVEGLRVVVQIPHAVIVTDGLEDLGLLGALFVLQCQVRGGGGGGEREARCGEEVEVRLGID